MFRALMLFMPCEPSKELLLAMYKRYGTARVHVTVVGSTQNVGIEYHKQCSSAATVSMVDVWPAPEVWEFVEWMGSFSFCEIWMSHRYTYRDVLCSSHRPDRDVEADQGPGARAGPVYYSAYGDGTPYATPEDADIAAAMLKAVAQTSP